MDCNIQAGQGQNQKTIFFQQLQFENSVIIIHQSYFTTYVHFVIGKSEKWLLKAKKKEIYI